MALLSLDFQGHVLFNFFHKIWGLWLRSLVFVLLIQSM